MLRDKSRPIFSRNSKFQKDTQVRMLEGAIKVWGLKA